MITSRSSGAQHKNTTIKLATDSRPNTEWLASLPGRETQPGAVILFGGVSVVDFRLRVAQSHLRHDLLPSFWSQAGILVSRQTFLTVPLDERLTPSRVPSINAIHECPLAAYDNPAQYPNMAVINFAEPASGIVEHGRRIATQRSVADLPQLVIAWLAFAWGAGATGNPLMQNYGIPSATFVETAFGIGGIELTPGVASAASCPEAIWQSALWWHEYYEKTADAGVEGKPAKKSKADAARPTTVVPFGTYVTRQLAAAVVEIESSGPVPPPAAPGRVRSSSGRSGRRSGRGR